MKTSRWCVVVTVAAVVLLMGLAARPPAAETAFYPMAVWYSGGKARAPMLSVIGPESPIEWAEDLGRGTSFYPRLTSPDRDFPLERRALVMDAARAVTGEGNFYVGELQAGYGVHGIIAGNPVTPNDLEMQTWGMVARGAKAISYYAYYPMSSGYEAGGYGLVNLDGTLTERSRRAGATARLVAANADAILAATPQPAEAAIVFYRVDY